MTAAERASPGLDHDELRHLRDDVQGGVIARRQIQALGGADHDIARMVRRRDLRPVHPGVYVAHTGPLSWEQRAWAGVLAVRPAALAHWSALPASMRTDHLPIHVAVDVTRTVRRPSGVIVHRMVGLDARVEWLRSPPRVRLAEALIDVLCGLRSPWEQYRLLADACQTRLTTADQVAAALARRTRVVGRAELVAMLADLGSGACSVLERAYLALERRHGLPTARRQQHDRLAGGTVYRDVRYDEYELDVELDGRAFHDTASARDRDFERDLDTRVLLERTTVRLSAGQVLGRGCATIAKIGVLLARRGWAGPFRRCPDCP